ncbi:MAG: hypothetical protein QOG23_3141 [Blastocatellia bacterium]|jgi:hypothetical protein|nr:hypothetical protein [Blastocatellia bacterium]
MIDYRMEVTLKLNGPIMTRSTAAGSYGIDAPFARNERNELCLPLDLVRGRLRQAMTEIEDAVGSIFNPTISEWFGKGSGESSGSYAPERGLLGFTDFVCLAPHKDDRIYRIRIDSERGSVLRGAYQVIEAPFQVDEEAHFTGTISFFAADQNEANKLGEVIRQSFSWITSFGSQKSIGFGQLIGVSVTGPVEAQPHASISTNIAPDQTGFDLVVTPLAPFCLTSKRIDQNLFESDDIISGGAVKGALATTWLKWLGKRGEITPGLDSSRPELCSNFEKIRFTSAFPGKKGERIRPVTIPYSTVSDNDTNLHDVALFSKAVLINGAAPSFFMDWKTKVWVKANARFGWDRPQRRLDVHHEHDRETRKAKEAQLFAFDAVDPQDHEWLSTVDLSRVPQNERAAVAAQLQEVLRYELKDLGKTKSSVRVEWQGQSAIAPRHQSNTNPRDGLWIITLQTPALICDPNGLNESSGAGELRVAYEQAWLDLSDNLLQMERYFAGQHLAGGDYLHRRFQSGKPYNPFLMTDAGSVFVLKPTQDNGEKGKDKIEDWLLHGLPLPGWAIERFKRNNENGDHWSNCPYVSENGYGEIAVNLGIHWDRDAMEVYLEV